MRAPGASRAGLVALVAANLLVALLTLRNDWGYYQSLIIYWLEAVILGFFTVLRLAVVGTVGAAPLGAWIATWLDVGSLGTRLFLTAVGVGFFAFKFGTFALALGLFVGMLPGMLAPDGAGARTIHHAMAEAGPGIAIAAAGLILSHAISFVRNFLLKHEYDRLNVLVLVFFPYMRLSLVGTVLLAGVAAAYFLPGLDRQTAFALVMILVKMGADAVSHTVEHHWLEPEPAPAAATPPGPPPETPQADRVLREPPVVR